MHVSPPLRPFGTGSTRYVGKAARSMASSPSSRVGTIGEGSSRQCCESSKVQVLAPSIACVRTASISGACGGNEARSART